MYQYFWGRNELVSPLSGLHCKRVLGVLSLGTEGCCADGFKPAITGYCVLQLFNLISQLMT